MNRKYILYNINDLLLNSRERERWVKRREKYI